MDDLKTPQFFLPETEIWDLTTEEKKLVWKKMLAYALYILREYTYNAVEKPIEKLQKDTHKQIEEF